MSSPAWHAAMKIGGGGLEANTMPNKVVKDEHCHPDEMVHGHSKRKQSDLYDLDRFHKSRRYSNGGAANFREDVNSGGHNSRRTSGGESAIFRVEDIDSRGHKSRRTSDCGAAKFREEFFDSRGHKSRQTSDGGAAKFREELFDSRGHKRRQTSDGGTAEFREGDIDSRGHKSRRTYREEDERRRRHSSPMLVSAESRSSWSNWGEHHHRRDSYHKSHQRHSGRENYNGREGLTSRRPAVISLRINGKGEPEGESQSVFSQQLAVVVRKYVPVELMWSSVLDETKYRICQEVQGAFKDGAKIDSSWIKKTARKIHDCARNRAKSDVWRRHCHSNPCHM